MSAPGVDHEMRVALLDACAVLSGHLSVCRLAASEIPDVVRTDPLRGRLFVGDAKDTETPGCAATSARMHAYARALRPWLASSFTVRLAVCHGRPEQSWGWSELLEHAARCAGLVTGPARTDDLGAGTVLTWLDVALDSEARPQVSSRVLDDVGASH